MSSPLVTVLIDTYNHERFIEQAIISVLEQNIESREIEIIVVDDGSTDNTPTIVQKFVPHVRYIRKKNGGQASAFNIGILEAKGEIISFLDGDDWWKKEKLQTVLKVLEEEPEVGAVGHGIIEVYGHEMRKEIRPTQNMQVRLNDASSALLLGMLRCFLGASRFTARRQVLKKVLPIPEELIFEADEFLSIGVAAIAPISVLDQCLTFYRIHEGNLFQIYHVDDKRLEDKLQNKHYVLTALYRLLPSRLHAFGIQPQIINLIMRPIWVQAERLRLYLYGGTPWETFRVERIAYNTYPFDSDYLYRIFKIFVWGLALVMPPKWFYRLRVWYARKGLWKLRERLGRFVSGAPIEEKFQSASGEIK